MNALYLTEITIVVAAIIMLPAFKRACDTNWLLHKLRTYVKMDVRLTVNVTPFQEAMRQISQAVADMEKRFRS